jgi:hypothetical protein
MTLPCTLGENPPGGLNLEINTGPSNQFHLDALTSVGCLRDDNIMFIFGTGTGTWRSDGTTVLATVTFTFSDAGETGTNDFARYLVATSGGTVLSASGTLAFGNQQFHPTN